jgi:hypothetical protein
MTWSELLKSPPPLSMRGLLAFMERWKPGSTQGFEPTPLNILLDVIDGAGSEDA